MTISRQILLVEDDLKTVELIRLYLERDGYQVSIAYNGREGLEFARQKRPDLIVLDLFLLFRTLDQQQFMPYPLTRILFQPPPNRIPPMDAILLA